MDTVSNNLLMDLISFRVLLTPAILVLVYYFGAILLPVTGYLFYKKLSRLKGDISDPRKGQLRESLGNPELGKKYKKRFIVLSVIGFLMMELAWRIFIEFFIAYFQMHNALINLQGVS